MSNWFVVLLMLFCHVIDDYYFQIKSNLNLMKQKKWWKDNAPQKLFRYDYIAALSMHCISWSFMVMFPIAFMYRFSIGLDFIVLFLLNTFIHGIVDNIKANKMKMNLIVDQFIHILQIIITAILLL